jgi:hypothetical protein
MLKKKIWPNFLRIIEVFTQNLSLSSQKYGFGIQDPRSEMRKKPIPDPGSRGQKGTGSRIRIRNTGKKDQKSGSRSVKKIVLYGKRENIDTGYRAGYNVSHLKRVLRKNY